MRLRVENKKKKPDTCVR